MGTNACVSRGLKSSTFSNCVTGVNRRYDLSDASCEYVKVIVKQYIPWKKNGPMATMLTILQNEITLLLSSFRAVNARKACLSTALAGCDDCYLNAIVATSSTFMTNQHLQCGNRSLSQSAIGGCGADAGCSETMMKDQQVLNCFTGYKSYISTVMASAGDDPAAMKNAYCSYVKPI